jgi:hypothetical protein
MLPVLPDFPAVHHHQIVLATERIRDIHNIGKVGANGLLSPLGRFGMARKVFGWAFFSYCLGTVVHVVVLLCLCFFPSFHVPANTPHSLLGFLMEPHFLLLASNGASRRINNRKD